MKLVFIRHGQTPSNVAGALDTAKPGADLNELGHEQSRTLVGRYREIVGTKPAVIVASDRVRTQQTIGPLAEEFGLSVRVDSRVREIDAGDIEMATDPDSYRAYFAALLSWMSGNFSVRIPGAENATEVLARFMGVLRDLEAELDEDAVAVICAHGAVLRFICSQLSPAQISVEKIGVSAIKNARIVVAEGGFSTGWEITTWNDRPYAELEPPEDLESVVPADILELVRAHSR